MVKKLPINIFYSIISALVIFIITPLYAQEIPSNIANMLTAQQLEDLKTRADQKPGAKGNNLPVAKMPKQKNINDLKITNTNDLKYDADDADKPLINYYYEILTQEELDIYGREAFAINENNNLLFYNTTGADYQLAAGDVVHVIARGLSIIDEEAQVDNLGRLTLPIIAPFLAHGKTLDEIKDHILRELKTEDASASAYITLSAARLIQVKVTGAVNNPQTIAIPAYTPLSQVISRAGGISSLGSLRNIVLTNSHQDKLRIDLYNFLREANDFKEPLITASSRIHVNDIGLTVAVSGFVGRPKIFELPPQTKRISAKELLKLANANLTPFGTNIEILNFNNEGIVNSTKFKSLNDLYVNEGEALRLSFSETRNLKEISVKGAVLRPFKVVGNPNGISLKALLKGGAVLKQNALKRIAFITSNNKEKTTATAINLGKTLNNSEDLLVFPGDILEVLNEKKYATLLQNEHNILYQNISDIYLDEKRIAFIPDDQQQDLKTAILSQIILNSEINKDFALLSLKKEGSSHATIAFNLGQVLTSNTKSTIDDNSRINLFTNKYLSKALENINDVIVQNNNLRAIKETNPVEIFMDG
ncbi:SLBB domain-containing protein, partial [Paracoccaceae bacterium]|nr:SLBB domain-containing protein [Paracoccaceae bacterium]